MFFIREELCINGQRKTHASRYADNTSIVFLPIEYLDYTEKDRNDYASMLINLLNSPVTLKNSSNSHIILIVKDDSCQLDKLSTYLATRGISMEKVPTCNLSEIDIDHIDDNALLFKLDAKNFTNYVICKETEKPDVVII